MALAVLVSKKIYNFSELVHLNLIFLKNFIIFKLEQPILISLNASQYTWVYQLITTFNRGDVNLYEKQSLEYKNLLDNQV